LLDNQLEILFRNQLVDVAPDFYQFHPKRYKGKQCIFQLIAAPPNVYFSKQMVDYAYECNLEEVGASSYVYSRAASDRNEIVMERKEQN
jgi:hypothetical protein